MKTHLALGSEIHSDALLLPVAIADRLGSIAAAEFGGQVDLGRCFAAGFGLGQGAHGFGGQRFGGVIGHRAFLGIPVLLI